MTIATPLSLRWERVQHIDRSAIEPLGPTIPQGKEVLANPLTRGALGACLLGNTVWWDTLAPRIIGDWVSLCRQGRPRIA